MSLLGPRDKDVGCRSNFDPSRPLHTQETSFSVKSSLTAVCQWVQTLSTDIFATKYTRISTILAHKKTVFLCFVQRLSRKKNIFTRTCYYSSTYSLIVPVIRAVRRLVLSTVCLLQDKGNVFFFIYFARTVRTDGVGCLTIAGMLAIATNCNYPVTAGSVFVFAVQNRTISTIGRG